MISFDYVFFAVNTAFMHYFDSLTNNLETHILQNWTMWEQVLPISLQSFDFDSKITGSTKDSKRLCLSLPTKETKIGYKRK